MLDIKIIPVNILLPKNRVVQDFWFSIYKSLILYEPSHGKTNNLQRQKQRPAQISFAVTAKLISAFVFSTWIAQFLYFLNPKFPASNHLLRLYSPVCVGPGRNPN